LGQSKLQDVKYQPLQREYVIWANTQFFFY
jgi:hypothetical protein